jgi:predicted RNA binding protein YcfA (HicA-like mRNA interferase family)
MAKLPATSGKALVHALEKGGFVVRRKSGSHFLLEHSDGRITVVPVHGNKDLPTGTLRGILRDVEITAEQFQELL